MQNSLLQSPKADIFDHDDLSSVFSERLFLRPDEVEAMVKRARGMGRHGVRNSALILISFRHGLRSIEAINLKWSQIDFSRGKVHIARAKKGIASVHPLRGREIRLLRQLKRDYPDSLYVFQSQQKTPLCTRSIRRIVKKAGELAEIEIETHPHQLRHACGYYLANCGHDTRAIQDYLGHSSINHTVRYTKLSSNRFENFWKD